jgi:hypothetical protein
MFSEISFLTRAAWASVLGSGCMLVALMSTQSGVERREKAEDTRVVSAKQDSQRDMHAHATIRAWDQARAR